MTKPLYDKSLLDERFNLLATLFDRMPMGIAVFDRDYRLRRCNPTWATFIERYGPPSVRRPEPGMRYADLAPGTQPRAYPFFDRVLGGETIERNALRMEAGGKVSYWDMVIAPLSENGEITGLLLVTIDATERVRTKQELERHRDRLEEMVSRRTTELREANEALERERNFSAAVLDTAGALVVVMDREGRIVRFNQACERTTGWDAEEVRGRPVWEVFVPSEDEEGVKAVFRDLTEGQFPRDHENVWLTRTGERRLIRWSNTALTDGDDQIDYVVATGIDVTERRRAERRLQESHSRLEQQVERRTAELHHRLAFENLVSTISADFINRAPGEIDEAINQALEAVGTFMDVDRSYVFLFSEDKTALNNTYEWCATGIAPQIQRMQDVPTDALRWSNEILLRGDVLHIPFLDDLPPEAKDEWEAFQAQDIQSLVAVPMISQGETIGLVGFDAVREARSWADESIKLLKMLATILVNALERKRAQAIQEGQRQFLELLATGGDFSETLHTLVSIIEEQWPGMQALVLLLDEEERLRHGASLSLPEDYVASIDGLEIGPLVGSCGTACYRGERVIVEDIATDPRWDGLRDLALDYGLRACWSEPVLSPDGDVVGTFAMYYREPRSPTASELRAIEIGAHLAGVAIERKRADEALRESERMLSTLISNLPGMAYRCRNDADWTMTFVSGGSTELTGYRPEQLTGNREVTYARLIHPDDRASVRTAVETALDEGRHFEITYRILTSEGEKWVWERGQGVPTKGRRPSSVEGFITDITERVTARQNLEQRVEERTHELATLLEISHSVASKLELEPLLGLALDRLGQVVAYDAASTMILQNGTVEIAAYRGPIPQEKALRLGFPLDEAEANRAVVERREPVIIDDVRGDGALAQAIQETAGEDLDSTYGYIRAWMGIPLVVKDRVVGMLTLDHSEPGYYTRQQAELAMAFANQVAVAIDNARLYEAEQERLEESERRRQVAEGLRDILSILNSNQALTEVLDAILEQAFRLLGAKGGVVYRLDREVDQIKIITSEGMPEAFATIDAFPVARTNAQRALLERQPFAVPDFAEMERATDAEELPTSVHRLSEAVQARFRAGITVPLLVEDEVYGAMTLYYDAPRAFSEEETNLVVSFADQAALAVENARLRDEVEKAAVTAERSRLARDLHDAVTQTLFSSSLIADVLPRIWEANPEEGRRRLDELRELTRGALAEMRTLLLELRPAALVDAELRDLLKQLGESITGRARVPVTVEVTGDCNLTEDVKVALYRIAQESLNNVAKHANATRATVSLHCQPERAELCVRDDGSGFDPAAIPPDSLGLGIMRERAETIDADLQIESEIGEGTQVEVVWRGGGT
jgi:PAS domain S-box-containing protein